MRTGDCWQNTRNLSARSNHIKVCGNGVEQRLALRQNKVFEILIENSDKMANSLYFQGKSL